MVKILLSFLTLLLPVVAWGQSSAKCGQGYPFIRNFTAVEYKAHAQNFSVTQDNQGLMYFGNFAGVLQFDGIRWRLIPTSLITKVSSLARDSAGRIFVGARGEIGYLAADSRGNMFFQSLLPADTRQNFSFLEVIGTFCISKSVYFITEKNVFSLNEGKLSSWVSKNSIISAFSADGMIFLQFKDLGLKVFANGLPQDIPGGERFSGAIVVKSMLHFSKDEILIATGAQGLFTLSKKGISPFITKADEFFRKNIITCATELADGTFAVGTTREGILILLQDGSVKQVIDHNAGLGNNYIQYLFPDKNHLLWAALNNGISLIEIPSAFSVFDEHSGLNGSVNQILRFEGRLFVSTSQGLNYLDEDAGMFKAVPGIFSACWSLLPLGKELLAATSQGLFMINRASARLVAEGFSVSLAASGKYPDFIFTGQTEGLFRLRHQGATWNLSRIPGPVDEVDALVSDSSGTIWGTSISHGLFRYDQKDGKFLFFDTLSGLPESKGNTLHLIDGSIKVATRHGLYTYNEKTMRFDPYYFPFGDTSETHAWFTHFTMDNNGTIWAAMGDETQIRYYQKKGKEFVKVQTPFLPIASSVICDIYPEPSGITWFGSPDRLVRYDQGVSTSNTEIPPAQIREVIVHGDSLVFGGNPGFEYLPLTGTKSGDPALPDVYTFDSSAAGVKPDKNTTKYIFKSDDNSLHFEFSVPYCSTRGEILFQCKLEGFEETWSDWTIQSHKEYTNLPRGKFIFHVRAKNVFNHISKEAVFSFKILSPWYFKWWAFLIYILMASGLIYLIVIYRNRQLLSEKKALEQKIAERTAEVVQQKEEIQKQSEELEGKNDELEKINTVVKAINSEINFSNLLQSLLEKTKMIKAVEKSTALILDKESGLFRFRASFGWDVKQLQNVQMTLQVAEKRYLKDAEEVFEDIFVKKNFTTLNDDMPDLADYEIPRSMLILVIKVDQKVEAFLILENMTRDNAFEHEDLSFVKNSKEHIISAFIKTRILEDLQSTLNNLKDTQDQLVQSQKLASLGELTAGIAHEIQNPLNFVNNFSTLSADLANELKGYIDEIRDKIPGNRIKDMDEVVEMIRGNAEKIHDHGKRAASIVKGMLQHSRGKSGEYENVEINNLVTEYMNLAYHGMRAKDKSFNTALKTNLDPNVGKASIIPQELSRVILNIVNNSCYAVDEKAKTGIPGFTPEVVTSTRKIGDKIEIRIRDNGTGIPQHVIDKIFNPFFTTKPTGKGTGLGLSMSYDIVTQVHKGKLEVQSKEGEYTEFIITIPEQR